MKEYFDIFIDGYVDYASYFFKEIMHPHKENYFYWLIGISLFFFVLEVVIPWRKKQNILRKDFWLDVFYMFFNFFLFSLIIYNAASDVVVNLFNDGIKTITGGFDLQAHNPMNQFPIWAILLIGFVLRDFIQWWIHRLLHYSDFLWNFHQVHHSVEEMGFAAHLRYHWMENVVYRTLEYIPLALLGINLDVFFALHIFTLSWGHYNHSNISISGKVTGGILGFLIGAVIANGFFDIHLMEAAALWIRGATILGATVFGIFVLGPIMKYVFNNPEMHIWHHSHDLPEERRTGINFGLTLAVWDYIFGTAFVPHNGRDIKLGFPGVEKFPDNFLSQNAMGFGINEIEKIPHDRVSKNDL